MWGTQPIEILGTKSGVYWEKKWFDKTDNRNKDLETGMIRLIERYWEEGKEDKYEKTYNSEDKTYHKNIMEFINFLNQEV